MAEKITFFVIKTDTGSYVGHSSIHPELMEAAQQHLSSAMEQNLLIDGKVVRCGDNLALIMTHRRGMDDAKVYEFCWNVLLDCPEEMYDLLMFVGAPRRYMVKNVYHRSDGEIAASASTQKLSLIARKYVGKDAPVLVTHCQSGLPTAGQSGGRLSAEPWTLRIPSAGTRRHGIHDDAGLDEETGRPLGKQRGRLKSEIDILCPIPLQGAVQAATESRQDSVQYHVRQVCG